MRSGLRAKSGARDPGQIRNEQLVFVRRQQRRHHFWKGLMRRALITGIGVISPLGEGKTAFFDNLMEGRSAIGPITGFDTAGFDSHLGGEVHDFKPETYLGRKTRGLNRTTRFLTAAIKLAIADAGLKPEETAASGVITG